MGRPDRIHRLLRVVEYLRSGQRYNSSQLASLCGVSRRTIFRDIGTLEESGIHVHYDEERQGYWLPGSSFIGSTEFTLDEALALVLLCHDFGDRQRGIPFYEAAHLASLKLLSQLPPRLRECIGEFAQTVSVRLEPHHSLAEAKPKFERLREAMAAGRQARITYDSLYERAPIRTLLSPYRMLFLRRSWYVIGRSSIHRSVRTFHIGRIIDLEVLDSRYRVPPRFTLDRFLGNAWHLIRGKERDCRVVVRFQPRVARNVDEVQWHKTQTTRWNPDGTLDFEVSVDGLDEIVWWILGYGDQAEVLEPPRLRDMVRAHALSLINTYGGAASESRRIPRPHAGLPRKRRQTSIVE